jgi:hypothetical protein
MDSTLTRAIGFSVAVNRAALDWRNRGTKAESRIQRLIRARPDCRAEWLQAEYCDRYPGAHPPSLDEIRMEQDIAYAMWDPVK